MQQPGNLRKPIRRTTLGFLWGLISLMSAALQASPDASPGFGALRFSNGGEMAPRLATDITIRVTGHLARTTVTQRFRNPHDEWVSATYLLPLPDKAAVDTLELLVGEQRIVGEIHPKQKAEAAFKAAERRGQRAALVSAARPNLFNTAVSNIPPQGEVSITLEYQETVARDGDRYHLRLPLTLTPRYVAGVPVDEQASDRMGNGWSPATTRVPDAPRITPAVLRDAPADSHRLTLAVHLETGVPLAEIVSSYHWIDVAESATGQYLVSLANSDEPLDHDFSLSWRPQVGEQVALTAFHHEGSDLAQYLSMQVLPPPVALGEAPPRELILVIDTSGSMQGVSMEQAKSAVQFAVNALRPVDRFNVIAFSDQPRALFSEAQVANDGARRQAERWVQTLSANGGTQMQPALAAALGEDTGAEVALRQVIFMTDGAVGDEAQLFAYIEKALGRNRLFTVGIGSAPNGWFMRKAAELGRGEAVTISALAEVEEGMKALFARLGAPTLTDLQAHWPIDGVEQLPVTLPDLYAGQPIDLAVRASQMPSAVRVTGTLWRDGVPAPWEREISLTGTSHDGGRGVAVAWARQQIEALIDDERRGVRTRGQTDIAITDLALTHHIVTRTTSLVAVDQTPARSAGEQLMKAGVPNLQPYGQSMPMGQLVATGTAGPLQRWIGLLSIVLALAMLVASRWQAVIAPHRQ